MKKLLNCLSAKKLSNVNGCSGSNEIKMVKSHVSKDGSSSKGLCKSLDKILLSHSPPLLAETPFGPYFPSLPSSILNYIILMSKMCILTHPSMKKYTWSLPMAPEANTGAYTKDYMACGKQTNSDTFSYIRPTITLVSLGANLIEMSTFGKPHPPFPSLPPVSTIFSLHQTPKPNLTLQHHKLKRNLQSPTVTILSGYSVVAYNVNKIDAF